jgi:hypothetical protein
LANCLQADEDQAENPDRGIGKLQEIYDFVESEGRKTSNLVIITHGFVVSDFPEFFIKKRLNGDTKSTLVNRGEGWVINCAPLLISNRQTPILQRLIPQAI